MVNPVSSGYQSYPTAQPSFASSSAEAKVNTQDVQPRQAPAADTQKTSRDVQSPRNNSAEVEFREKPEARESAETASNDDRSSRGSLVDMQV